MSAYLVQASTTEWPDDPENTIKLISFLSQAAEYPDSHTNGERTLATALSHRNSIYMPDRFKKYEYTRALSEALGLDVEVCME